MQEVCLSVCRIIRLLRRAGKASLHHNAHTSCADAQRLPPLLTAQPLPPHLAEQILPLLLNSTAFGHPTRLDYGTGHELAFMLALWCCVVSGYTRSGVDAGADPDAGAGDGNGSGSGNGNGYEGQTSAGATQHADDVKDAEDVEDELVLRVFPRYVEPCVSCVLIDSWRFNPRPHPRPLCLSLLLPLTGATLTQADTSS